MQDKIPYLILWGVSKPKTEDDVYHFQASTAIVQNRDTGKYLALEFISGEFWLVGWALEAWEDYSDCILREVFEESGYRNAKIEMTVWDLVQCRWYKKRKDREELVTEKVFFVTVQEKNNTHITINNFDSLLQKRERSYFVQTWERSNTWNNYLSTTNYWW